MTFGYLSLTLSQGVIGLVKKRCVGISSNWKRDDCFKQLSRYQLGTDSYRNSDSKYLYTR